MSSLFNLKPPVRRNPIRRMYVDSKGQLTTTLVKAAADERVDRTEVEAHFKPLSSRLQSGGTRASSVLLAGENPGFPEAGGVSDMLGAASVPRSKKRPIRRFTSKKKKPTTSFRASAGPSTPVRPTSPVGAPPAPPPVTVVLDVKTMLRFPEGAGETSVRVLLKTKPGRNRVQALLGQPGYTPSACLSRALRTPCA